jgi:hypothetical protein
LKVLDYLRGLRKWLALFKVKCVVVLTILLKIRYRKTCTANSAFRGCKILSLTLRYYYELHKCKNKILLRTHKDSLKNTWLKLSVQETPFIVHISLSWLWGGTNSRRNWKNKNRNRNFIENMAAVRRDRQKNGLLERQFVVVWNVWRPVTSMMKMKIT